MIQITEERIFEGTPSSATELLMKQGWCGEEGFRLITMRHPTANLPTVQLLTADEDIDNEYLTELFKSATKSCKGFGNYRDKNVLISGGRGNTGKYKAMATAIGRLG